jgi:hypothetical protein
MPTTQKEVRSFARLCNFYAKLIHHFSDRTAPLTDLLRKYEPHEVTLMHACLEAFEALKLRLIPASCLVFPEIRSDAMSSIARDASTVEIGAILLQNLRGGLLQPVSYWARKLFPTQRGNTYSTY